MAGSVGDAVVRVGGTVVKQLCDFSFGGGSSSSLFGANFAECMEELVVNGTCIVEEGSHNSLNTLDADVIKGWASVWVRCVLGGGTIGDGSGFVG